MRGVSLTGLLCCTSQSLVKKLRSKWWVLVLFGLISLGQAYPYSYAWGLSRQVECSCNRSGRKCIHGCKFRKKVIRVSCHDHEEADPSPTPKPGAPEWVSPNCSKSQANKVLSFQWDPFIPSYGDFSWLPSGEAMIFASDLKEYFYLHSLDPPPPRL